DILWFVHVDAEVPHGCLAEIERLMNDPGVAGGYFRIRLPRAHVYRLTDSFAHYAGILLRMRCGDHGIFCRRTVFLDIGGFPGGALLGGADYVPVTWRIVAGAGDGRYRIFSPALSQRSRHIQPQANSGKFSSLRGNRTRTSDTGLWIYRNALRFRRPIVDAG